MINYFENVRTLPFDRADADADEFDDDVQDEMRKLAVREEAKRRFAARNQSTIAIPPVRTLTDLLAEPDTETAYLIEGLAPAGGRVMLTAKAKTGKSTIVGNLVRSLVDGTLFLGRFRVNRQAQRVVVVDNELSENMVRRWLRVQGIVHTDGVDVVCMRGRVGSFNILDERCRAEWADELKGADHLIFDCLRPALDALGLDEHRDAGKFLVAIDALLAEADIPDALLVHHMGHTGERARGDSRLQDWPDVTWRVLRANEDPDSDRFFTAFGRDVDLPEGRLTFDAATRRLTYSDGTRKATTRQATHEEVLGEIVEILAQRAAEGDLAPMTRNQVLEATKQSHRDARTVDPALKHGVAQSVLTKADGPRNSHLYSLANPCTVCFHPISDLMRKTHPECEPDHD